MVKEEESRGNQSASVLPLIMGMKNVSLSLDLKYKFVSPVLEVCGCMGGLLSALGAVGMSVFMVLYIDNSQILA